jgi:hypothetical protein
VAAATADARICEMPVRHHARRHGQSKYGLSRVWKVLGDLLVIKMIGTFRDRPLRLFAAGAGLSFLLFLLFGVLTLLARPGGLRPEMANAFVFPGATLLWLVLASYLLLLGLVSEVIVRQRRPAGDGPLPVVGE